MNPTQQAIYRELRETPPAPEDSLTGIGSAYWHGFNNPEMSVEQAGPIVGLPGSNARAAFKAGQRASKTK